ncbi:MAG: A24 family peptidase [Acidobacteriota bacterium]|nr:A24 family peptidase [Acidobacteriota bacterium]
MSKAALAVLAVGLLSATVIDIKSRRIPNELTAGMAVLGMALAVSGTSGLSTVGSILGICFGLLLMMPGYTLGATGAGDVKLMAGVGAIVGPALVLSAFLFTAIAGGVLALIVAIRRQRLAATLAGTGRLMAAPASAPREIRAASSARRFAYGPAIAIGSMLAVLTSW